MASPSHPSLTPGTIKAIYDGTHDGRIPAWLQFTGIRLLDAPDANGVHRYKVVLSDGQYYMQGTLVTSLNHLFQSRVIDINDIVKVTKFNVSAVKNHRVIFIGAVSETEVVKGSMGKIGEPINVETASLSTNQAPSNMTSAAAASYAVHGNAQKPVVESAHNMSRENVQSTDSLAVPISGLSPYHNRWTIRARITSKSALRTFSNKRGEGRLFSVNLIDGSGEIKATAFNDAVDRFYDLLQVGGVYELSNAAVKIAKRQYSTVDNDYEIHLETGSVVTPVADDSKSIPTQRFAFCPIQNISQVEKDAMIDVIGVITADGDLSSITTKTTQKQLSKRDLTIVDKSGLSIKLTLWGEQAEAFQHKPSVQPIIAVKGAKVGDYGGRSLSALASSTIVYDPDIPEAHELRGWFDSQGIRQPIVSLSSAVGSLGALRDDRKLLSQIKDDSLGQYEKPDYLSAIAAVIFIKSDAAISYTACPSDDCNKKVVEEGPNQWRCERCQKVFDRCDHRYVMSLQLADHSAHTWVNAFNETGTELLGRSAEDLYYMKMNNLEEYNNLIKQALFKSYLFKIRVKQENYNGEMKIRSNIISALPINYAKESADLIQKIKVYEQAV